ncbi:PASTA domain-containing protein, partial [Streptomyces sp. FL07-04A]
IGSIATNGKGDDGKGGGSSASPSATKAAGYRAPDPSKTIEATECSEPQESYNDPDKIRVPDFKFKYIGSVKECLQAAGWKIKVTNMDENTYGAGAVMDQFPSAGTDVDPKNMPEIELRVSTGNPAS